MGDSHGAMLAGGLAAVNPTLNLMQAVVSQWMTGEWTIPRTRFEIMRYVYEDYLRRNRPDLIILAANWQMYDL